ncbi:putative dNA polymerase III, alpha subunit, partial [Vibrio parahaemolyticus V-223/04]
PLTRI